MRPRVSPTTTSRPRAARRRLPVTAVLGRAPCGLHTLPVLRPLLPPTLLMTPQALTLPRVGAGATMGTAVHDIRARRGKARAAAGVITAHAAALGALPTRARGATFVAYTRLDADARGARRRRRRATTGAGAARRFKMRLFDRGIRRGRATRAARCRAAAAASATAGAAAARLRTGAGARGRPRASTAGCCSPCAVRWAARWPRRTCSPAARARGGRQGGMRSLTQLPAECPRTLGRRSPPRSWRRPCLPSARAVSPPSRSRPLCPRRLLPHVARQITSTVI